MEKLLLEYKRKPAIFEHGLETIDETIFINVFTNGNNIYERNDFTTIEEALENSPTSKLNLSFIYLESYGLKINIATYKNIKLNNSKLLLKDQVEFEFHNYKFTVQFDLNFFVLKKTNKNNLATIYHIIYHRREISKTKTGNNFETLDSFYELIPRFEDIFLETIFLLDIMTTNYSVSSQEELEAYMLQAKTRIEKDRNPIKLLDSDEDSEPTVSNEQIELSNLIGLEKIKLEIQELKIHAQFRKKRIEFGLPVSPSTLHMVFSGNPGTGKTTVARLLGQIYHEIGLLAKNKVIEVSRTDLVGQFVGHTAPKTKKVFESALGGILFIDEAYSLFKSGNDFGSEAIETLLKLMEDNREKIIVIIAGYTNEIEDLLSSNPGLKSRFSKHLHFDDYSKNELIMIFNKMVLEYRNNLSDGAKYKIEYLIERNFESGYFSSNARAIRNIFEESIKMQSNRLSKVENPTQEEMTTFTDKDIPVSVY